MHHDNHPLLSKHFEVSNGFYQSQPPQNAKDSDDTSENWIFEALFCHASIEIVAVLGGPAFAGQKQRPPRQVRSGYHLMLKT